MRHDASAPCPPASRDAGLFHRMAAWTIRATGGRWGFLTALFVVVVWAISGPYFQFSQLWQLVINTATTIVTFLMVFLIQNAQNRESKAVHLKLDELIYAVKAADNELINIEMLTDEQLEQLADRYRLVAERHRRLRERLENGHAPELSADDPPLSARAPRT
jgi:low affinity Fe/Cu permease